MKQILISTAFLIAFPLSLPGQAGPSGRPAQVSAAAAAQTAGAVQRFGLSQCIQIALENSNRTRVSRDAVEVALALRQQALSSWWPQLSASVTASRMDQGLNFIFPASTVALPAGAIPIPATSLTLPANSLGPGFPPVNVPLTIPQTNINIPAQNIAIPRQDVKLMDRDHLLTSARIAFPIYTGGLRGSRISQANSGVEVARNEQRRTALEVTYDVRRLYYGVILAQRLASITRDTLARMEATLELTERLYKTGSGTVKKTDYLRNRSMVETIRSMSAEMEAKENTMRATLQMVMGLDLAARIELADSEIPFSPRDVDAQGLIETAFRSNPELKKLESGIRAAEAGVRAARGGLLPKLAIFADTNRLFNKFDAGVMTPQNRFSWMFGAGIEIPIFDGFRATGEMREASANLQKLRHQQALLRDAIALEVRNSCFELIKAQQQQKSAYDAFQSAVENRDLNIRAYQEELVETKDVIEAQLMEALMAGQYQKVLYENMEAQAKLDFAAGREAGMVTGDKN